MIIDRRTNKSVKKNKKNNKPSVEKKVKVNNYKIVEKQEQENNAVIEDNLLNLTTFFEEE